MKQTFILLIFAATFALLACKQAQPENKEDVIDPSSETNVPKSVLDYGVVYPKKSSAGFSPSKRFFLDTSLSCLYMSDSHDGKIELRLEYIWRYYDAHKDIKIMMSEVPVSYLEDGSMRIDAQGLQGAVTYVDQISYMVETSFAVEATIAADVEGAYLKLESEEIYLDVEGFSSVAEEKAGTWAYIEYASCDLERFINSMDSDITIDLGEYKVESPKKDTTYELTPVTLAPGEVWEFDYCSDSYPNEGYYYGLPATISIHYAGEEYRVKKESIVPMKMEGERMVFDYEIETEYHHDLGSGFFDLFWYPIYIYRITPEVFGL